jgi:hypothetical protein
MIMAAFLPELSLEGGNSVVSTGMIAEKRRG